ncbi:Glycoside hydrolase family 35 protein [Rhizoctonia solani]|uniref:Glycoside hydrolase family 35 protein n=1 Tax=Rhizoctonia solani TaxID=456999 RepID=A0A8H7M215_9AGAM|nr:Glycoside hydrolase family 35 protein [Rhizoctonia solani]
MSSRGIQFPNSVDRSGAGRFITFVLDCESWGYKFTLGLALSGVGNCPTNVDLSQQYVPSPGLQASTPQTRVQQSFDQHSLLLDGKRIWCLAGSFIRGGYLLLRLAGCFGKDEACGFRCGVHLFPLETFESKRANLNFEGYLSVTRFLEIAKDVGILVIVRPGPYINAETTGGGYPGWLTNVPDTARSNGSDFTPAWKPYIRAVSEYTAPCQYPDGPVILVQSENEYSMDNPIDKTTFGHTDHMKWVIEEMRSSGITRVPITHNDRKPDGQFASGPAKVDLCVWDGYPLGFDCSNPDVLVIFLNLFDISLDASHQKRNLAEPLYLAEYQGGAFDPWSGPGYGECYKLINEQFANVFYKNNYAAGTYLQNLFLRSSARLVWAIRRTYAPDGGSGAPGREPALAGGWAIPSDSSRPEDRSLTTKYSEIKLQALFLHATPHYHLASQISTDATHASLNYIWTTHLATPKGQNLYIIRHDITALHTSSTSKPIVSGSSSVTASISNGTALISGVPLSNGLVRVAVGNTSVGTSGNGRYDLSPRTGSVLVFGPYLARNATINGSTLDITGDAQSATTTKLEVLAPSIIEHVTFDGQPVTVSKSTTGTLKGSIRVKDLAPKLPNLSKTPSRSVQIRFLKSRSTLMIRVDYCRQVFNFAAG